MSGNTHTVNGKLSSQTVLISHVRKLVRDFLLIRKVKWFGVSLDIMGKKVYVSLIESIIVFNISVWYGHMTSVNRNKLTRIVRTAGKLYRDTCQSSMIIHTPFTLSFRRYTAKKKIERVLLSQVQLISSTNYSKRNYETVGCTTWVWMHWLLCN